MNRPLTTHEHLRMQAMAIVDQILDLSGADVKTRQKINDLCDDIVSQALLETRIDETRKWSDGEISIYSDNLDYIKDEIQNIIKSLADMRISHLNNEKGEVDF